MQRHVGRYAPMLLESPSQCFKKRLQPYTNAMDIPHTTSTLDEPNNSLPQRASTDVPCSLANRRQDADWVSRRG
eukprot:2702437-Lingulodinium_polyedra.AAC.1